MALSKIKGTVIADDAINADRIEDGTVVASDILDNTITGGKLATDITISTTGSVTANTFSGDGSSLTALNISTDSTPQLGGNLDLNSNDIIGTGNVDITGNVSLTGTVDGRDIATDGTKLDGIATSATANPNAIDNVVEDTTPQLGGNLDLNSNDITGTGNINITGNITASGNLAGALTTASQPNITSVGTLTSFTSTGIDDNATSTAITIDSSERVLINQTSTISAGGVTASLQLSGTNFNNSSVFFSNFGNDSTPSILAFNKSRSGVIGTTGTIVQNGDEIGNINWNADDGTNLGSNLARISGQIDGVPGVNDTPGRLVFYTTADGAALVTERMRIDSSGFVLIGKTDDSTAIEGTTISSSYVSFTRNTNTVVFINRQSTDGALVSFRQANSDEGNISVSGTTVSYNGGHLSRWSQLLDNSRDESIVKGTVMSNLDEMCVWGDEDNEQLNKMKVSDTEGDDNVAGVFVNWDNDDDVYINDMNIAMTGDMVIRIAQGVPVHKGQLLMSAGDGTAKPQGDDIVRSKTIAKVTSNNVTKTYDDGSYLVPCVLMAC